MAEPTMQESASDPKDPQDQQGDEEQPKTDPIEDLNKKIAKDLKSAADATERDKKSLSQDWKRNVDLRMGKPYASVFTGGLSVDDDIQTEINPDWSLTKTKTASLFSQVPSVQGTHHNKQFAPAVPAFMKQLNYELGEHRCNASVAMEECLNDIVNAAGFGAIYTYYTALTEEVEMPVEPQITLPTAQGPVPVPTAKLSNEQVQKLKAAGLIHTQPTPRVVSDRFDMMRISPSDLLWPKPHTSMDFDRADWVGFKGRFGWADGKREFKLDDKDKQKVLQGSKGSKSETDLRAKPQGDGVDETEQVHYRRIFYWRYRFDPDERHLHAIWQLVYVDGMEEPVLHEPYKGQQFDEQTKKYIGVRRFPLQFCTITYISDNPIPPSDSQAGRPQVNDLRRSRSQMFQQRARSTPLRWHDVNRIDPDIGALLMKGIYQGSIPVNGDGGRSIGEIARASYPSEDFTFDQIAMQDLMTSWQIDAAQQGMPTGRMTNAQAQQSAQLRATRQGQERAQVAKFFLRICDVLAGLMVLFSDFSVLTDQEKQQMQQVWDQKHVIHDVVLKIRPDSQVVLDSGYRIQRLMNYMNMTVKSGYVNPKSLITELTELHDLDPTEIVVDPQPKPPEDPSLSFRFSGKEDLTNPAVIAILMKHKQLPSPQELDAAKKFLQAVQEPPNPEPPGGQAPPGGAGGPGGPHPPGPPGAPVEGAPHAEAQPSWQLGSRIAKRSRDVSGG